MTKKSRRNYIKALSTQVEHKKMYKAKKQWVVAGISFLVATGLGAVGSHMTTHADTVGTKPQVTSAQSKEPTVASSISNSQVQNSTAQKPTAAENVKSSSVSSIQSKANGLHSQLLLQHQSSESTGSQHHALNLTSDYQHNTPKHTLTSSEKNDAQQTDNTNWIYDNKTNQYTNDTNSADWKTNQQLGQSNDFGLTWKYNQKYNAVEFTGGTATKDTNINGGFDTQWTTIPDIKNASSIKFNSDVDMSKVKNMQGMFMYNNAIKSIDFGTHFNSTSATNMSSMFVTDPELLSVNLNSMDTSNVTNMSEMFNDDNKLQSLTFGNNFNPHLVTSMQAMFNQDYAIKSLVFPNNFDTSDVSDMSDMFQSDYNLTKLVLPSAFNTKNVTNMASMFQKLHSIQSLTLPTSFDTSSVKNMSSMFSDEHNMTSLTLPPAFNTNSATTLAHMFDSDYHLQSLDLSNFNTNNVSDMYMMFVRDNALNSLKLGPNFNTTKAMANNNVYGNDGHMGHNGMSDMFANSDGNNDGTDPLEPNHSLQTLIIQSSNSKFNKQAQLGSMFKLNPDNTTSTVNDFSKGLTGTFTNQQNSQDVNAPKNIKQAAHGMWGTAEWNLYKNGQLDIHDGQINGTRPSAIDNNSVTTIYTSNLTAPSDMSHDFYKLPKLTTFNGNNLNVSSTNNMIALFASDTKLSKINISSWHTSNLNDIDGMFKGDTSLSDFSSLENWDTSNLYTMNGTFSDTGLKNLNAFAKWNVNNINYAEKDDGYSLNNTFANNKNLSDITGIKNWLFKEISTFNWSAAPSIIVAGMFSNDNNINKMTFNNNSLPLKNTGLSGNWIKLSDNPQSYSATDLMNNKDHIGTWTKNAEIVQFTNNKQPVATKLYLQPMNSRINLNNEVGNIQKGLEKHQIYTLAQPSNNTVKVDGSKHTIALTPTLRKDTDTIALYTKHGNYNVLVSKFNVNGNDGSTVDISKDIPNDYTLPSGASSKVTLTANTSAQDINLRLKDGQSINTSAIAERVTPESASADVQYQYNKQTVASDSTDYHGNNWQATDAGNNGTTISNNNEKGLPNGWHLDNSKGIPIEYNDQKQAVSIDPDHVSDNVIYQYNGSSENNGYSLGSYKYGGNDYRATQAGDNGIDITSTNVKGLRSGYHLVNTDNEIQFNNKPQDIPVAPNNVTGTAILHLLYTESNGHKDKSSDIQIPINAYVDDKLTLANPLNYAKDGYTVPSSDFTYTVPSDIKKNPSDTFTYEAPTAANVTIQYYDTATDHHLTNYDKTLTASAMEQKPYNINWIVGNHIKLGIKGSNDNAIDVLQAPAGYKFAKNYPITTVILPESKLGVTLRVGLIKTVAPNSKPNSNSNSNSSKPASSSATNSAQSASSSSVQSISISMNSSELSSLAHEIGGDINVTVRPNVTNTTVDSSTLNSLASEVAINNQEISSLANKPTSAESIDYNYFNNLVNNGVTELTDAINKDFRANISNVHAKKVTPKKTVGKRTRTYSYLKWLRVVKPLKLYNAKHKAVKVIKPRHRITLNVKAAYKVNNHIIFKVSYRSHNYFIRANNKAIKNAYLPATKKLVRRRVRVLFNVYANRHVVSGRVKTLHRGYSARIKNIVRIGSHNVTRIQLSNGLWISANMNYVKVL